MKSALKISSIKKLLFAVFLFSICFFTNNTFAQRGAGGSSDGSGDGSGTQGQTVPPQPCPTGVKRNNGQGTCGGDAQVRLSFNQLPDFAPTLVAIWDGDEQITGVMLPVEGDVSNLAKKGYISYCLSGSNIPPAHKLIFQFHYANSTQDDCMVGE